MSQNDSTTFEGAADSYRIVGWVGFTAIFIFNLSFVVLMVRDVCCLVKRSNGEQMRAIRRDYYYEKIVKYESENCVDPTDAKILDDWVVKGDLN